MGGRNRAGERVQRASEEVGGNDASPQGGAEASSEMTTEAARTKRSGKRTASTKKSASSKGSAGSGSRKKEQGREAARGTGSASSPAAATGPPSTDVAAFLPVREDEEQWTPAELEEVRAELEREITGLRQEIARAESEVAARLADPSDGAGDDQADTGAKTFEREHEMSLANNARDLLGQNERAIARMEAGTYGVCEACGNPIGKARLQAFPRAALCVTCKQREERR